jgi:hypothetical protein
MAGDEERTRREAFSFDARYGRLIRKAGIGTVPFALFFYQGELDLTPQEVWLVAYVLAYRWTSDLPFPAIREIGRRSGVGPNALNKYKKRLEEKGFLQVVRRTRADGGNASLGWDFSVLFERLDQLIVRDIALWTQRNPQFLEEDLAEYAQLAQSAVENPVENAVEKLPPVIHGGNTPASRGENGAGSRARPGAVRPTDNGPFSTGDPRIEEEADEADSGSSETRRQRLFKSPNRTAASNSRRGTSMVPQFDHEGDSDARTPTPSPTIDRVIRDYAERLHDAPRSARSNCTRARRLRDESGLAEEAFIELLHEAYRRTQQNSHRIRKGAPDRAYGAKNKTPYFFAVLSQLVDEELDYEPEDGRPPVRP